MPIQPTAPLKIAVIGLGYVGLPLAVEFGKQIPVVGYDILQQRIDELQSGHDRTHETSAEQLQSATFLRYSSNPKDLQDCTVFIITVPTPVDSANRPDLSLLILAARRLDKPFAKMPW